MSAIPRWVSGLGLLSAVMAGSAAEAGPIFVPGRMADGEFTAPADRPEGREESARPFSYEIRFATVSANVADDGVTTEMRDTILGPASAAETVCLVPLPVGTQPDSVEILAGPGRNDLKQVAGVTFLDERQAAKLTEQLVKQTGNVAFAALSGRPMAVVPTLSLEGRMDFVVRYRQTVRKHEGVQFVEWPTPATGWASGPVERLTITANITASQPLRAMFSPTHDTEIERDSLTEAVARVRLDRFSAGDDFRLCWVADRDDLGLRVLTHRMEGEEDGFFLLLGNPTGRADGSDALDKDVTFVLDTSGSMRGEKIEQSRAAIDYCLDHLNAGDRFNIVTFGTEVQSFREDLVPNRPETVAAARDFIEEIVAQGRTNIGGALKAALRGDRREGRPRIAVFLTDGTPTAGELVPDNILKAANEANTSGTQVFVLGVGHDVNVHLLDKLAESSDGGSEFVDPDEEIDAKVAKLYDRLSAPVLAQVKVDFGGLVTHTVFPQKVPALFRNSGVMLFGRYREGGKHTATVSGTVAGKPHSYQVAFQAPEEPTGNTHDFVAPLWASRTIGFLLQEIRLHGENPELLEEIVRLSKQFGIVTEYTNFVAIDAARTPLLAAGFGGGGPFRADGAAFAPAAEVPQNFEQAVNETRRRLLEARDFETGEYAVNQAKNDKFLQSKLVAGDESNVYFDRQGRKIVLDTVRQIGGRTFYQRNGQWSDAAEADDRKERVVQLYSDDYFELLKSNEDFRRAQKLGWALSINVGDERIVIEKDGKRTDESLLPEGAIQDGDQQQQLRQQLQQKIDQLQQLPQRE